MKAAVIGVGGLVLTGKAVDLKSNLRGIGKSSYDKLIPLFYCDNFRLKSSLEFPEVPSFSPQSPSNFHNRASMRFVWSGGGCVAGRARLDRQFI